MKTTKDKGDISEAKLLAALVASGCKILTPWGDNSRYDMVIDEGKKFSRVQVKTGRLMNGAIVFKTCSINLRTQKSEDYIGQVEYFGVYCPGNDKCYLIPISAIKRCKTMAYLRVNKARNGAAYRDASLFEIK